jgi:3-oxoacyl-[acyl-carrier-protein] synthase II
MRDKMGRPIVVVTGSGIVTSLGAGKVDNWKRLTAGESGIRAISRFPTDSLKTKIAGTVDFVPVEPLSAPELSERLAEIAIEEAISESAAAAASPDRCFSPSRRSRSNGRSARRSPRHRARTRT